MIPHLSWKNNSFLLDGSPSYLNSGEFHYFRVPKKDWKTRLLQMKEAGVNMVATYIPWLIHEPREGVFHIDRGDGITDLSDFLTCAEETGMMVMARPGPYSYSELRNAGLPDWLLRQYPQIGALNRKGETLSPYSVSYLHPLFLEKVRKLYAKICPILAAHSVNRGGCVTLVQLDNELCGIHIWLGDLDFHPDAAGFGQENGKYANYLRKKYGSVEQANQYYQTQHPDFASFGPRDEPTEEGDRKLLWNWDYWDFYCSMLADYLEILASFARQYGVDVPFCHNPANWWHTSWFREAKKRMGDQLLLGCDHYYMLSQLFEQNHPTPQYMIGNYMSLEMMRLLDNPPSVLEFQYGSIAEWPPVCHEDLEATLFSHAGFGMRGHNGYVFTGGPNPPDCGTSCDDYDYGAPIASDGTLRPSYFSIKKYGDFLKQYPGLCTDEAEYELRCLFPWQLFSPCRSRHQDPAVADISFLARDFPKGLLAASFAAGWQIKMVEQDDGKWQQDFSTPLIVCCSGIMEGSLQQQLADYVRHGGHLILWPAIPRYNEKMEPCCILAQELDADNGNALQGCILRDQQAGTVISNSSVFPAGKIPDHAEVFLTDKNSGAVAGWSADYGNQGHVSWLGASFFLQRHEQWQMLDRVFRKAGAVKRWFCDNGWVLTSRRKTKQETLIFLSNLGTSAQRISAEYHNSSNGKICKIGPVDMPAMHVEVIVLPHQ